MSVPVEMLVAARAELADVIESLGDVSMALREAIQCASDGLQASAEMSANDAVEFVDEASSRLLRVRDRAGRWAVWMAGQEVEP